jgi:hypothetical protein
LVQLEWPTLREIAGVALTAGAGFLQLSADRTRLIHVVGQSLVSRRSDDFGVLWTRQIDSDIDMMELGPAGLSLSSAAYCLSGDGSIVALAPRRFGWFGKTEKSYLEILNGNDGQPIRRWPVDGFEGLALSPEGSLVAIAHMDEIAESHDENRGTTGVRIASGLEPAMHIHEIPSGREVTSVVHDRVSVNQRLGGRLDGRLSGFTPDGKYLITSNSYKVKIWQRGLRNA